MRGRNCLICYTLTTYVQSRYHSIIILSSEILFVCSVHPLFILHLTFQPQREILFCLSRDCRVFGSSLSEFSLAALTLSRNQLMSLPYYTSIHHRSESLSNQGYNSQNLNYHDDHMCAPHATISKDSRLRVRVVTVIP